MAAALQLALLHQAGVGPLEILEQPVPDSVIEGFRPESPPIEIHAFLENFWHKLWARHGQGVMLCYMAS